jgi:hypothetical protein
LESWRSGNVDRSFIDTDNAVERLTQRRERVIFREKN